MGGGPAVDHYSVAAGSWQPWTGGLGVPTACLPATLEGPTPSTPLPHPSHTRSAPRSAVCRAVRPPRLPSRRRLRPDRARGPPRAGECHGGWAWSCGASCGERASPQGPPAFRQSLVMTSRPAPRCVRVLLRENGYGFATHTVIAYVPRMFRVRGLYVCVYGNHHHSGKNGRPLGVCVQVIPEMAEACGPRTRVVAEVDTETT